MVPVGGHSTQGLSKDLLIFQYRVLPTNSGNGINPLVWYGLSLEETRENGIARFPK